MTKKLVIVESPSKCKTIQGYLGPDYTVLPSFGHMVDLASGGKFGIGIDLLNNFKPKYVLMADKKNQFDKIVDAASVCDEIFIASDLDREGEAIGKHIYERIKYLGKPISRIVFNEITKKAILSAVASPRQIDDNLFHAQQARRVLDRVVGFMVSPVLAAIYDQKLSAGRVQSVAVRLVVEREDDIKKFKPQEYWNIHLKVKTNSGEEFKLKYDGTITSKADADLVISQVQGQNMVVAGVVRKPKKEKAPPPLTTLMLQQLMAKKHGFDAERTMKAAQSCYESGYTTYIRTDSTRITDDAVKSIRKWLGNNNYPIPSTPNTFESKDSAADSHEAIRCTNVNNDPATCLLAGDDKILYEMVWRYSVACQMDPAVFDTLEVKASVGRYSFRASGKTISSKGYLDILGTKDYKIDIPNVAKSDILFFVSSDAEQKFTQPPPRFTEANLIKEMDARQIGRPSTMATILKNIISRDYVRKVNNTYHPTDLGVKITNSLKKYFSFLDMSYSAKMESSLDAIASGKHSYENLMTDFFGSFSKELKQVIEDNMKISCDKCNGIMSERQGPHGRFLACSGCRAIHNIAA